MSGILDKKKEHEQERKRKRKKKKRKNESLLPSVRFLIGKLRTQSFLNESFGDLLFQLIPICLPKFF
jgi:hypothetical protein